MDSVKNILPAVLIGLQEPENKSKQQLYQNWREIVGPRLAAHTKPSLAATGCLYIWVDQSALAFELNQRYKDAIMKRIENYLDKGAVTDVRIKVGQIR